MSLPTSACGIYECEPCEHRMDGLCPGCCEGNLAIKESSQAPCAVYECVASRDIESCLTCTETACALRRSVETICPLRSRFENKRWWEGRMFRALESRGQCTTGPTVSDRMSVRVISRLRWYLTALDKFVIDGCESVSSWQLAERLGVSAALIRKDLSKFGEFGTPSYGYRVDFLRERLMEIFRLDSPKGIAWIGACSLRHNCASMQRLMQNNCRILGVFDVNEAEIGMRIGEFEVRPVGEIADRLMGSGVSAAVVAISGPAAQQVSQTLVGLGARAVLNLSGELLTLPGHVKITSLDIAGELLELCYYCHG